MLLKWYNKTMRHLARLLMRQFQPNTFFYHPYWVEAWVFYAAYGYFPSFFNPKTIDEKLIVHNIKLWKEYQKFLLGKKYDDNLLKEAKLRILCADKYMVRNYVCEHIGGGGLAAIRAVYDRADQICFNDLPNSFVLKMNNASGRNCICKDKRQFNEQHIQRMFQDWMNNCNYGMEIGEWHYSYIPPKIICEEYLGDLDSQSLVDYKFHCFNGMVHSCFVCYDRDPTSHTVTYDHYDISWNHTEAIRPIFRVNERQIPRPERYDEMLEIAAKLSEGFPYARVDLYEIKGKVYFGEITLTPSGNIQAFYEPWFLEVLGNNIK